MEEKDCEHDTQIQHAIHSLKENPWDSLTLYYDAGEWSVTMTEDGVGSFEVESGESLLDRLNAAIQFTKTRDGSLLREHPPATRADPARKPADEDEAAAREWLTRNYTTVTDGIVVDLALEIATAREQGRQAGAKEMREACAKAADVEVQSLAERGVVCGPWLSSRLVVMLRALPLPDPRS